jgi:hypothetical protein
MALEQLDVLQEINPSLAAQLQDLIAKVNKT